MGNAREHVKSLATALKTLKGVTDKLAASRDMLSYGMQRNEETAIKWGATLSTAGAQAGALVNPMHSVAKAMGEEKVAATEAAAATARLGQRMDVAAGSAIRWGRSVQQSGSAMLYAFTLPLAAGVYLLHKEEQKYQNELHSLALS